MFRRDVYDVAPENWRAGVGHCEAALDLTVGVERASKANDFARHEENIRLDLKPLFRKVRQVTLAHFTVACEAPGALDRHSVLVALLAHG